MKQILHNINNNETQLVETPCPQNKHAQLFISTIKFLVTAGAELILIGLVILVGSKARSQQDIIKISLGRGEASGLVSSHIYVIISENIDTNLLT